MIKDEICIEYEKKISSLKCPLFLYEYKDDSMEEIIRLQMVDVLERLSEEILDKKLNFYIFWIDDDSVNASVVKIENAYCIGLFRGIITSLIDHINTFYVNGIEIVDNSFLLPEKMYFKVMDDSEDKGRLGNYIFTMSFFYIIMHEFGHILCGHEDKENINFRNMNFEQNAEKKGGYKSQAKEYMADFYGIANSLNMMLASFHSSKEEIINCVGLYLTAVQSIFWIFNVTKKSLEESDCSKDTHPHPIVRMGYFLDLIELELSHSLHMFDRRKELSFTIDGEIINNMVQEALQIFLGLINSSKVMLSLEEISSERCEQEIESIMKEVQVVKEYFRDAAFVSYE